MAGTMLRFANGYLGIERCRSPDDGKEYLRAVIHSNSTGRTTTAPVEIADVVRFAQEAVREALLADGHDEAEVGEIVMTSRTTANT